MSRRTFFTNLDGPANALATSKDANQVAVAGRNVFKIYDIDDDNQTFVESINLRVGKNINLNFSCNDVAWNQVEEHILATGATNGSVVVWNLQKSSRSKMDVVFQDHKRTVNKICFHPTEPHLLLTGSQDGTMKMFDLRKRESATTFHSSSESVRDVQFCPHPNQYFQFASVQENGNVQTWDFRRHDRMERQFTAHNGPVFACDWHPEEKKWLATAGRDKSIKVWDVDKQASLEYQINTIASVARIKWRPGRKFYIATCSLVVDFAVNVWDIRRPYIPYAVFGEHRDVTTGFSFRGDHKTLISAGKDNTLYQHVFEDAQRPANHANPMALDINSQGDISVAISDNILKANQPNVSSGLGASQMSTSSSDKTTSPTSSVLLSSQVSTASGTGNLISSIFSSASSSTVFSQYAAGKISSMFKKPITVSEQFKDCTSSLRYYKNQNSDKSLSMDWFVISAMRYQLTGKPFNELCEHNAEVAYHLNRPQVAQTWKLLQQLFTGVSTRTAQFSGGGGSYVNVADASNEAKDGLDLKTSSRHASGNITGAVVGSRHFSGNRTTATQTPNQSVQFNSNAEEQGQSETDDDLELVNDGPYSTVMFSSESHMDKVSKEADLFFGDGDATTIGLESPNFFSIAGDELLVDDDDDDEELEELPREAFNLRHVIPAFPNPPEMMDGRDSPNSEDDMDDPIVDGVDDSGYVSAVTASNDIDALSQSLLSSHIRPAPVFEFSQLIVDTLNMYASQGDVQTCVSVLIVLGDRLKANTIDELTQECWFTSYIELLSRFQLWNIANHVICLSAVENINSLNRTSTSLRVNCGLCGSGNNGSVAWICSKCKTDSSRCSVCHGIVHGLYVWCQGCSHGGHLQHIQEWLAKCRYCPSGCGHQCEYT